MEWWAVEAHRGSDWYCQPDMSSSQSEGSTLVSQLSGSFTGSGQLRKLIRKGIPPALRPKVLRAVSGVVKSDPRCRRRITRISVRRETTATRIWDALSQYTQP